MRRPLINWKQISVLNLLLLGVLATACMATAQQLPPPFAERPTTTAEMARDTQQPALATVVPTDTVSSSSPTATVEVTATIQTAYSDCPVTQPPETPFIPPGPWPSQPPGTDQFWYGDRGLWTALPASGSWRQLALGEKFWWWSKEFDVAEDATPDLTVTARRLNSDAPSFQVSEATNGYHSSFNWAMLIGVKLASPGCWEFTGEYKGHQLSFVLWVPSDIVATLATLPSTPSVEGSRFVLEAFFDAYNRHDLAGVLATLADPFVYGDCDFARRQMYVFETEDELTTWLNTKFADQDQFLVEEIVIAPTEGSPPDDPRNTVVEVLRTNTSLEAIAEPRRSLFKIILNPEGNRIQYLNTYGNVECEAGR